MAEKVMIIDFNSRLRPQELEKRGAMRLDYGQIAGLDKVWSRALMSPYTSMRTTEGE